mmetsp:Transcript_4041/g.7160  ORF Transcript_4041/g.7160 Transcript_4041/m.7160 type:complete len:276 (-) Transcript_4041:179-1006(-)
MLSLVCTSTRKRVPLLLAPLGQQSIFLIFAQRSCGSITAMLTARVPSRRSCSIRRRIYSFPLPGIGHCAYGTCEQAACASQWPDMSFLFMLAAGTVQAAVLPAATTSPFISGPCLTALQTLGRRPTGQAPFLRRPRRTSGEAALHRRQLHREERADVHKVLSRPQASRSQFQIMSAFKAHRRTFQGVPIASDLGLLRCAPQLANLPSILNSCLQHPHDLLYIRHLLHLRQTTSQPLHQVLASVRWCIKYQCLIQAPTLSFLQSSRRSWHVPWSRW